MKLNRAQIRPIVIGIAGGTGSGKSFMTQKIRSYFGRANVSVLDLDSYYKHNSRLSALARNRVNFDHPDAIDHKLLFRHVQKLVEGLNIRKPIYNFSTHSRMREHSLVVPASIVVIEGILALWDDRLRALMDLKIFVDAEADLRFIRRLERDLQDRGRTVRSVVTQYLKTVRPMHIEHIQPTRFHADTIIDNAESPDLQPLFNRIHLLWLARTAKAMRSKPATRRAESRAPRRAKR